MLTTKNDTSNAWPTSAVSATATTIESRPSTTGIRPATTAPNTSSSTISAAGRPISNSPFCRSSAESFSKSSSEVSEPVIATRKPSTPSASRTSATRGATSSPRTMRGTAVAWRSDGGVAPRARDGAERLAARASACTFARNAGSSTV